MDRSDDIIKPKKLSDESLAALRQARNKLYPSQGDFARVINKSATEYAKIERGERMPDPNLLTQIQVKLNVKITGQNIGDPFRKLTKREEAELKAKKDAERAARKLEKEEAAKEAQKKAEQEEEEAKKKAEEEEEEANKKAAEEEEKKTEEKEEEEEKEEGESDQDSDKGTPTETKSPLINKDNDDNEEEELVLGKQRKGKGLDDDEE